MQKIIAHDIFDEIINKTNPLTVNEILNKIIEDAQPMDFQLMAFPKIQLWRKELELLKSTAIKADGGFNMENKEAVHHYNAVEKKIAGCKVTRTHYLIHAVERLYSCSSESGASLKQRDGNIYMFNGEYWQQVLKDRFQFFIGNLGVKMGIPSIYSTLHSFRDDLFKQFISTYYLIRNESESENVTINLANGCFEVGAKFQGLREFRESDFLNYKLPFSYEKSAKAPMFEKFLNRVLPSKELRDIFYESIAYALTKNRYCKFEKMIIFKGEGANGKSVAMDIIQALLGKENISNYSLSSLTDEKGYSRANIGDKLVNIASELSGSLESDYFKQLSSGEPIEARRPYGDAFVMHDYARLIFACNILPQVEHTEGFFRRFLIIPFDEFISPEERDVDLASNIIKDGELSGIFNLVLEGLKRILKQRGFSKSVQVEAIGAAYKMESNSVLMFLEEKDYEPSTNKEYLTISRLYQQYNDYCRDAGNSKFSRLNFQKTLEKNGYGIVRQSVGKVAYIIAKGEQDEF